MTEKEIYDLAIFAIGAEQKAASLSAEAAELQQDARQNRDYAAARRAQVAEAMAEGGYREIRGPRLLLTARKTGSDGLHITDESAIPADFMTTPPPPAPKPDKNAIKAALKAGQTVPGCELSNGPPSVSIKELG